MYSQNLQFMVDDAYQPGGFNGTSENGDRDTPQTQEQLLAHNSSLRTRVSELEFINELFRGRLSQLEQQEAAARREPDGTGDQSSENKDNDSQLRSQLEDSHRRENNLKRRLDELELELKAAQEALQGSGEPAAKKPRLEDGAPAPAEQNGSMEELAAEAAAVAAES